MVLTSIPFKTFIYISIALFFILFLRTASKAMKTIMVNTSVKQADDTLGSKTNTSQSAFVAA